MRLSVKFISAVTVTAGIIASGFLLASPRTAEAANSTINPGDSIQTAIDNATAGDTVTLAAGTYTEAGVRITKPLTLKGEGTVIIKTKSTDPNLNKGIDIQNTHDVRLENLTFDGENGNPTAQTGIDINSVNGATLSNVTAKNYAKNGVAVVAQHDASYTKGGNITLTNVTATNNAWSGIAFYTKSGLGYETDLTGIVFGGITTVSGNGQAGIQFGDAGDTAKITGVDGGKVNLGTVHFANNQVSILNETGNSSIAIAADSTIDGRAVTATDFAGANVTIGGSTPAPVPGVPNTATAAR